MLPLQNNVPKQWNVRFNNIHFLESCDVAYGIKCNENESNFVGFAVL